MGQLDDLAGFDATALAHLVRRGEVSALELVDAAIARIERLNPALNAVVTPMYEDARRRARAPLAGPLAGVPYLLKDLIAMHAGVPLTAGSRLLQRFVPDHDSELVARLKRAGLVIVGKTNTPEFGILPTTEPQLFGPARNPWNRERTPGGSSGGSAAAVAAGMVPAAHGNDGGGSIRIPAACCGLFGLKPTRARITLGPDLGDIESGLVIEHAVTRSVRDSAALLDATAGPAPGDPYAAPAPARPFATEVGAPPGRLRIAVSTAAATGGPVHPDCVAAVMQAAKLCRDLGHEVVEATPAVDARMLTDTFLVLWSAGAAALVDGIALMRGRPAGPDEVEPLTWALCEMGRRHSAVTYLHAVGWLQLLSRQIAAFFAGHDIWLTPTLAEPPLPLGSFDAPAGNPLKAVERAIAFVPFTPLANITGQPAMSVPLTWNAEGLPIGTHWMGRFGDEATLFRLAAQLETARPWAARRPPIAAP